MVLRGNIGLFDSPPVETCLSAETNQCDVSSTITSDSSPCIVFFDLETSSFHKTADILQIAAKCGDATFSAYINPTQQIAQKATGVNGLTNIDGNLMLHGQRVNSKPRALVLHDFFEFLCQFKRKCILCAHNCAKFDAPRLYRAIDLELLTRNFAAIIYGFADTLPIIERITGKKSKGVNTLSGLASALCISTKGAHNAIDDVAMLQEIVEKLKISEEELLANTIAWDIFVEKQLKAAQFESILRTLTPLYCCTSFNTRKKMANANITYGLLLEIYRQKQQLGINQLFGPDENGKVTVSKSSRVLLPIYKYLEYINFK